MNFLCECPSSHGPLQCSVHGYTQDAEESFLVLYGTYLQKETFVCAFPMTLYTLFAAIVGFATRMMLKNVLSYVVLCMSARTIY